MDWTSPTPPLQILTSDAFERVGVEVAILREDLLHPEISGNKFRKLKYNLLEAQRLGYTKLLTFGGAYSNHIAALAMAGKIHHFKTLGIIRGEEIKDKIAQNPTLFSASQNGMQFEFITREAYRNKDTPAFLEQLAIDYPDYYVVPEGGTNELAIRGCEEILTPDLHNFDYISIAIGTGGSCAGVLKSTQPHQTVLGFPVVKGIDFSEIIRNFTPKQNYKLVTDYHFGGYGKVSDELIVFINQFKKEHQIPLDPLYTGKMVYGTMHLIEQGYFKQGAKILMIHTGGLQGITGINQVLKQKNKICIE